jgi:hypothetical protein
MKMADLRDLWQQLRLVAPLPGRGFKMRQCGASSHSRCFAAISYPLAEVAFIVELTGEQPRTRYSGFSTRAFSVDCGPVEGLPPDSTALVLTLRDNDLIDLFGLLCSDLAETVGGCQTLSAVPQSLVTVLERWRAFLQRRSAILTREEVRGLIGELVTLARLVSLLGTEQAMAAWKGPIGGIRDFESDSLYVETKTFTPSAGASIYISDALQLEAPTGIRMKLVCIALDQSPSGSNLAQYVLALESLLAGNPSVIELFRQRVAAAGFLPSMADSLPETYVAFEPRVFEVRDGFPRITSASISPGVRSVRFAIELAVLGAFAVPTDQAIGCRSTPVHPAPLP